MSEGSDSVPPFMASVFSVKALTLWTHVLGRKILLLLQGTWACLVKKLTPLWVSPMRKRVHASESKLVTVCSTMKAHL
jgi:hypothetical protein